MELATLDIKGYRDQQIPNGFVRQEISAATNEVRGEWFHTDLSRAVDAVLAEGNYQEITLIGKSLGTRGMAYLLDTKAGLYGASCVWLTPLLRDDALRDVVRRRNPRSLFVIGTDDSQYDEGLSGIL